MKNVFIIMRYETDEQIIEKIFDTKLKAEEYMEVQVHLLTQSFPSKNRKYAESFYGIEEHTVE